MKSKKFKEFPKHFNLQPYKPSGNAGVTAYEIGDDYLIARFKSDEEIYLYNEERPGKKDVDQMIKKAMEDEGLSTYINKIVQGNYIAKWDNDLKRFIRKK
ncbi:MAG: hypothetical protein ABI594_00020 [Ginsengibacter sp.]